MNEQLISEARNSDGYSEGTLRSLVRSLADALEAAAGDEEWGVRFRSDGLVEKQSSRERAILRASESTRIEMPGRKLVREIPPSDPERGRVLVSRTVTPWTAAIS